MIPAPLTSQTDLSLSPLGFLCLLAPATGNPDSAQLSPHTVVFTHCPFPLPTTTLLLSPSATALAQACEEACTPEFCSEPSGSYTGKRTARRCPGCCCVCSLGTTPRRGPETMPCSGTCLGTSFWNAEIPQAVTGLHPTGLFGVSSSYPMAAPQGCKAEAGRS